MTKHEALTKYWSERCSCGDHVVVHGASGCTRSGCRCQLTPQQAAVAAIARGGRSQHAAMHADRRLTYSERRALKPTKHNFALPDRSPPELPLVNAQGRLDPKHINNAAARLSMMNNAGHLHRGEYGKALRAIERAKIAFAEGRR